MTIWRILCAKASRVQFLRARAIRAPQKEDQEALSRDMARVLNSICAEVFMDYLSYKKLQNSGLP
jgi:hypothetical protein